MRSPAVAVLALAAAVAAPARGQADGSSGTAAPPGSELTVYVMTMGQGDLVWERYGHNAIGIRNRATGADVVFNWGMFSFEQPGFIGRFLRGEMMYWMQGFDAGQTVASYRQGNRTVEVQELNLSPVQRLAMLDFVTWNAREENRYYRYDYFLDNCSTRVRDALDRILGGAIRQATDTLATGTSYRWHSLRLMADDPLISTGVDIGLGRPTDRPISAWEEMFIPMRLRDHLRGIRVPDDSGRLVPLVTSERVVFAATRAPERDRPPRRWLPLGAIGVLLAAALAWSWRQGRAGKPGFRRVAVTAAVAASVVIGGLGTALLYLRFMTAHVAAWDNTNVFVYNPLWLVTAVAMLLPGTTMGRPLARALATAAGFFTLLGLVLPIVPGFDQRSYAVILLAAPLSLVMVWIVRDRTRAAVPDTA